MKALPITKLDIKALKQSDSIDFRYNAKTNAYTTHCIKKSNPDEPFEDDKTHVIFCDGSARWLVVEKEDRHLKEKYEIVFCFQSMDYLRFPGGDGETLASIFAILREGDTISLNFTCDKYEWAWKSYCDLIILRETTKGVKRFRFRVGETISGPDTPIEWVSGTTLKRKKEQTPCAS